MSKFDTVMANLRESLRHATPEEDGQPSYCMVRKDELEALIGCVNAALSDPYVMHAGSGRSEIVDRYKSALSVLEACADE